MIRTLYLSHDGELHTDLRPEQFAMALQDAEGTLWVDFMAESPQVVEPFLRNPFGFHQLSIDDTMRERHVPKIDDWMSYLFIVLRHATLNQNVEEEENQPLVELTRLDVFLGPNFLVTNQHEPTSIVDKVWEICVRTHVPLKKGADYLLYRLADELLDNYLPILQTLEEQVDDIEDTIFDNPSQEMLGRIFILKQSLLDWRRTVTPQRQVFDKLSRESYSVIRPESRVFFRDVYDHMERVHGITESMRDAMTGTLNIYLSVANNQMNEVMKTLTVITTLFMPLSFIVGFFGMNFFQASYPLPAWTGQVVFFVTMGGILFLPFSMYLWMRHRGWM